MQRNSYTTNVTIQMQNPVTQQQFGLPIYRTMIETIMDGTTVIGQPAQLAQPMIATDITPDLLAALNAQFATLGLKLNKIDA